MTCAGCGASLELDGRVGVVCIVTRDRQRLCAACGATPGSVGGGQTLTREQIDREVEKRERKYAPGGYKRGDAAAARGPREAS